MKPLTLGSLFDGIGGFPFAAEIAGITPIWASEIEPFGIAVTKQRFPDMLHLGSVTDIDGAKIPPVDIISFGSPCQDFSVAGMQKGMKQICPKCGEEFGITDEILLCPHCGAEIQKTRSGLLVEAVRIIYEMRKATDGKYPTFIIWENVPGAFSSNKGHDFRAVLEEITKTDIPMPASGRWANAGVVRGSEICAAWRLLDAQYWGVPQRRKRIFLIGSFGNNSAEEILFNCDSVQWYPAQSGEKRKAIAGYTTSGIGECDYIFDARGNGDGITAPPIIGDHNNRVTDYSAVAVVPINELEPMTLKIRSGCEGGGKGALIQHNKSATLACNNDQTLFQPIAYGIGAYNSGAMLSENPESGIYVADTARTLDLNGGNPACNQGGIAIVSALGIQQNADGDVSISDTAYTLSTNGNASGRNAPVVCLQGSMIGREDRHGVVYALDRAAFNQGENAKYDFEISESGINSTLVARGPSAVAYGVCCRSYKCNEELYPTLQAKENGGQSLDFLGAVLQKLICWIVRRLTPRECERLQGYPDDWTVLQKIDDMTDEEYRFFLDVFMLDKKIRDKKVKKPPTKESLIKWHNKLDCDGNRYKALGNSLAIPCALRVVAGIAEYVKSTEEEN